jgi:RhoGEF domain
MRAQFSFFRKLFSSSARICVLEVMAERLANNPLKGKLVEQKINRFAVLKDDFASAKMSSPSLRELTRGNSRVKLLSKVFEEQTKTFSAKTNWWLEDKSQTNSAPAPKPRNSLCRTSAVISPVKATSKIDRIISELLQKEETFLQALERGINYYVSPIRSPQDDVDVPELLREQTFRLFGNIEEIYKLHKFSIFPRLKACNGCPHLIAETMSSYIQNDQFYDYIVYSINHKSAEQLISHHGDFFEHLRSTSDDLLGVYSFIIQPIQKLPRYKMFFDEMIKELTKDVITNKEAVAACCVAEKNVQRLLARLNEALTLNDIIETREYSSVEQLSFLTSIQKELNFCIREPLMLIVPKLASNFPTRSPINIFDQGKFIKCASLRVNECAMNRTFASKIFLFEKCLMYTKVINENSLGYRNHFPFDTSCSFDTKESPVSIRVCGPSKKHDVIISSDNIESIAEMKKLINQFYDPRRSGDSAFVDGNELMICEDQDIPTDDDDGDDEDEWLIAEYGANQINLGELSGFSESQSGLLTPLFCQMLPSCTSPTPVSTSNHLIAATPINA